MQNIKSCLIVMVCLLLIAPTTLWATIFKIERKCYKNNAYGLANSYGIKANAANGKVEVRMYYKPNYGTGKYTALIYGAYSQSNSVTNFNGTSINIHYPASLICAVPILNIFFCSPEGYDEKSIDYKSRLLRAFNSVEAIPDGTGDFFYWPTASIDMVIELELTGNITLSDVKEVSLPGVNLLKAQDFVNPLFKPLQAGCVGKSAKFCTDLTKVVSMPANPNNTDVDIIIETHRGLWGEVGTPNENTRAAINVACDNPKVFLLESDIMPIGVTELANSSSNTYGQPSDLACFHDYFTDRYSNIKGTIFDKSRTYLESNLKIYKSRSKDDTNGTDPLLFFDQLVGIVVTRDKFVCADMKALEGKKNSDNSCNTTPPYSTFSSLCDPNNYKQALFKLYKKAIQITDQAVAYDHVALKTYLSYDDLKAGLMSLNETDGESFKITEQIFNKVLWVPMVSSDSRWQMSTSDSSYDPRKIQLFLGDWFSHNDVVLCYEANFKNDFDHKTSVLLDNSFSYFDRNGTLSSVTAAEYIYRMTNRRTGIFAEETVGGKGNNNRWGDVILNDKKYDRRGDHIWLINKPFMNYGVYVTDRPDVWWQF